MIAAILLARSRALHRRGDTWGQIDHIEGIAVALRNLSCLLPGAELIGDRCIVKCRGGRTRNDDAFHERTSACHILGNDTDPGGAGHHEGDKVIEFGGKGRAGAAAVVVAPEDVDDFDTAQSGASTISKGCAATTTATSSVAGF